MYGEGSDTSIQPPIEMEGYTVTNLLEEEVVDDRPNTLVPWQIKTYRFENRRQGPAQ